MNDVELDKLRATVDTAEKLKRQIKTLDDFIASSNNAVGYLNVTMNHKNQNEIQLISNFETRVIFDWFKDHLREAAELLKSDLEGKYKELEVTKK